MSFVSLILAFVSPHNRRVESSNIAGQEDSLMYKDGEGDSTQASSFDNPLDDDIAYYEQVAEEFMALLPSDKRVIARLIDGSNHHIIYYETTDNPSCYCYDLETQNTSVLFSSDAGWYAASTPPKATLPAKKTSPIRTVSPAEIVDPHGFYIDTKLLIIGRITECKRVGEKAVFIATNREPEASYEKSVHVFEMNLYDQTMRYIAFGASAYFTSDTQLVVNRAKLLYRSLFTNEDVYTTAPTVYDL